MSGDTDKAKISDNQDEDKKSSGDGQTTEDESSQDSKGELAVPGSDPAPETGNADVDQPGDKTGDPQKPTDTNDKLDTGDATSTTANGKGDKDVKAGAKGDVAKKEENGETHDDDEEEEEEDGKGDVKENAKGVKKPAAKKKAKKEDTEDEEDEEEDEEEEDEEGEEGDEEDEKKDKKEKVTKKPAKKAKEGEGEDDEEEEEEGEEGEEGEEEEEEEEEAPKPKPKKEPTEPPVPLPAGKGIPLGHIGNVEISLSRFKTQDQKILHQYLYGQLCLDRNVKRNIKKFKGYEWAIGSSAYKAKLEETTKMESKQLRALCEMLDLDKKGSSADLASRIVGFLQCPTNNSPHARGIARAVSTPSTPGTGGRPRRSAAVKLHNRGYSDEEDVYESDPETKVKGAKLPKDGSESDGSFNPTGSEDEPDSDFDPEAGSDEDGGSPRKRKSGGRRRSGGGGKGKKGKKGAKGKGRGKPSKPTRGRKAQSESEDESDKSESEEDGSGGSGDESDASEPKAKRGKPAAVAKGKGKAVAAKNAKATPAKRKAPAPPAKKGGKPAGRPAKKKKASSDEEGSDEEEEEDEEGSEEEDEDSDSPADKKKRPPTDDEIKKYVKQILEGANLEQITMKTVCKQVYSHYPDFDLAHKKDFIKATVKSLISS